MNQETNDPYELAPETEPEPTRGPAQPVPNTLKPPDPGAPHPLNYRTSKASGSAARPLDYRTPAPADDAETIRNLYMPLGFLVAGLVIELVAAYFRSPTIAEASVDVTLTLVVRTGLMMVAMLIAARFRQIELGPLPLALLKLAAVAVGPSGLVLLLRPMLWIIPFGGLIELVLMFALFYALLGAFFDLDESDTWYCVLVMFVVWVGVYFGLMALDVYV